jgi:hypothetical protein
MKILDVIATGAGAVIGIVLGVAGYLKLYLPLKASLGLGQLGSQGSGGEGPIVPTGSILPYYRMAGTAIDLIVLLAFAIAGVALILGILRALRGRN